MRTMAVVACVAMMLAGCADDGDLDPTQDDAGEPASAQPWLPLSPGGQTFTESTVFEGTFALQDSAQIQRLAGQATPVQVHPLPIVPIGQPVLLTVHAEATTTGDIDVFLDGDMHIWRSDCDCPLGPVNERVYHLQAEGPIDFVIQYDEHGSEASFDYTAEITVQATNETFLSHIPVALELEPGQVVKSTSAHVLVHGPDDTRLGGMDGNRFQATVAGEHVFFPFEDTALETNASTSARLLALTQDTTDRMAVGADFNHTFTAPANALYLGYCVIAGEATVDPDVRLTGPEGVLATESTPGPHLAGNWGTCMQFATPDLEAYVGDYNLQATTTASQGTYAVQWLTAWQR